MTMEKEPLHRNNKRLAKNTLYLYFRTLFVMAITLFTSRVVLEKLGIENYGIYSVVGGFVSMFSVLSSSLTAGSQRFIAYELGKEKPNVRTVFSTTVTIHIFLASIVMLALESIGLWYLNCKMNISPDRLYAANWVFQCSVITFCVNIISIPYNAAIIAFEKMSAFAYISIFEAISKLGAVYALYAISQDSLITYALFMLLVAVILRLIYGIYCSKNFKDCRYDYSFSRDILKQILGFCGWNFIGSTAGILNGQGINMLINSFFGVALNAARGVAMQVDTAINTFVQNFMLAINPQITKSYAAGDFANVNNMIYLGTRFAFFLFGVLCLPVFMNAEFLLSVWLKEVPPSAVLFTKYAIIFTLCQNLSQCLYIAMLATGRIKKYQIVVGSLSIMAFPTAWIFFRMGLPAEWGYISMILFSLACLIARLILLQAMTPQFSAKAYITEALFPIAKVIVPIVVAYVIMAHNFSGDGWAGFILQTIACIVVSCICIWTLGLSRAERNKLLAIATDKLKRTR